MKLSSAIKKAMQIFEKRNLGDIRVISIFEVSGLGDDVDHALVRIEYKCKYFKDDIRQFMVSVDEAEGKIIGEVI
jgi:hypothetical protein